MDLLAGRTSTGAGRSADAGGGGDGGGVGGPGGAVEAVEWARSAGLDEVEAVLIEAGAALAAGEARLAQVLAVFEERRGHERAGVATLGMWCSVNLGLTGRSAGALAAAGAAAAELPALRAAWESGALSTDKARLVASVVEPRSESKWVAIALEASAGQLARITATYRRATSDPTASDADAGAEARDRDELCGLSWHTRGDGLVELVALLDPADAALVRAAIETAMERDWRRPSRPRPPHDRRSGAPTPPGAPVASSAPRPGPPAPPDRQRPAEPEPAPLPAARRRLEALLDLCETSMASGPLPLVGGERTNVVLHVDLPFLLREHDVGRSHVGRGWSVDRETARYLSCDARVAALLRGTDGEPVDLGRAQRLVSDRQRRLVRGRDVGCRFPGCTNERFLDVHHVVHWAEGGRTDMANLLQLCRRHHRLHHQGAFQIVADGKQGFEFLDERGRSLGPPRRHAPPGPVPPSTSGSARARSGGDPRYSLDLTVTALAC